MGTFEVNIGSLSSSVKTWRFLDDAIPGNVGVFNSANVVSALSAFVCPAFNTPWKIIDWLPPGVATILVSPADTYLLDGVPRDRLNTPPGFLITDFSIAYHYFNATGGAGGSTQLKQGTPLNTINVGTPITTGGDPCATGAVKTHIFSTVGVSKNYSILHDPFGFTITQPNTTGIRAQVDALVFTGNYVLWSTTLTLSPTTITPNSVLRGGATFQIDDSNGNLRKVTAINVSVVVDDITYTAVIPPANIVSQTPTRIIFTLPSFSLPPFSFPEYWIPTIWIRTIWFKIKYLDFTLIVDDPTFSPPLDPTDPIPAGSVEILWANASGVYTLQRNKSNDTLYDNDNPGTTEDVAIPDPFGNTGYIGG
jgi:hypothetical protein